MAYPLDPGPSRSTLRSRVQSQSKFSCPSTDENGSALFQSQSVAGVLLNCLYEGDESRETCVYDPNGDLFPPAPDQSSACPNRLTTANAGTPTIGFTTASHTNTSLRPSSPSAASATSPVTSAPSSTQTTSPAFESSSLSSTGISSTSSFRVTSAFSSSTAQTSSSAILTASPTATFLDTPHSRSRLSKTAAVGIAVGVTLAVGVLVAAAFILRRKRRRRSIRRDPEPYLYLPSSPGRRSSLPEGDPPVGVAFTAAHSSNAEPTFLAASRHPKESGSGAMLPVAVDHATPAPETNVMSGNEGGEEMALRARIRALERDLAERDRLTEPLPTYTPR